MRFATAFAHKFCLKPHIYIVLKCRQIFPVLYITLTVLLRTELCTLAEIFPLSMAPETLSKTLLLCGAEKARRTKVKSQPRFDRLILACVYMIPDETFGGGAASMLEIAQYKYVL